MTRRRVPALTALAALALVVSACGSDGGDKADAPAPSASSASTSASASGSPSASTSASTSASASSADAQVVSADGVSFEVPKSWVTVDPTQLFAGGADSPAVTEMADRLGVSADQLTQMMSSADLYALDGGGARNGFVDNVNLISIGSQMPTPDEVRAQLAQLGLQTSAVDPVSTDAGDGLVSTYAGEIGGAQVYGRAVTVDTGAGVLHITASASDAQTAADLGDRVAQTLQPAG